MICLARMRPRFLALVLLASWHEIVVVELADGRTLRASPGHPTLTKRIGELAVGDVLDGGKITKLRRETFTDRATWDLLPGGPTGVYWADGVLIGSTLRDTGTR